MTPWATKITVDFKPLYYINKNQTDVIEQVEKPRSQTPVDRYFTLFDIIQKKM